jgi:hypothetical protein
MYLYVLGAPTLKTKRVWITPISTVGTGLNYHYHIMCEWLTVLPVHFTTHTDAATRFDLLSLQPKRQRNPIEGHYRVICGAKTTLDSAALRVRAVFF